MGPQEIGGSLKMFYAIWLGIFAIIVGFFYESGSVAVYFPVVIYISILSPFVSFLFGVIWKFAPMGFISGPNPKISSDYKFILFGIFAVLFYPLISYFFGHGDNQAFFTFVGFAILTWCSTFFIKISDLE